MVLRQRRLPHQLCLEKLEDRTVPSVFTVTNTLDDGSTGSLRWAINQTYADADPLSTINFNIASSGMQTIQVMSALPTISHPVTINGYTEPGSSANTLATGYNAVQLITLDGTPTGSSVDGLVIAGGGSTVSGLRIQNFASGIHLQTSGNNVIAGNFITSTVNGVFIDNASNNTIGGAGPAARNLCAANGSGIAIWGNGAGATGNQVQGNYIGTDGNQLLANGSSPYTGVFIFMASYNTVGGTAAGATNVISTLGNGILIEANTEIQGLPVPVGNCIAGNYIGTNAEGTVALTQATGGGTGVAIFGASDTTIGGSSSSARNLISGWPTDVLITDTNVENAIGNLVQGNFIGMNAAGTQSLLPHGASGTSPIGVLCAGSLNTTITGNVISGLATGGGGTGVSPDGGTTLQGNFIGTDISGTLHIPNDVGVNPGNGSQIGGTTIGAGNTIAFNNGPGVWVTGDALNGYVKNVTIEGNSIHDNGSLGIDLGDNPFGAPLVANNVIPQGELI
jgi:parallel beta-helix repeat protein